MRKAIAKSVAALCMIACAQLALGADDGQLKLGLRLPFIQRESAFDYIVDANHWIFERRAAAMSYDSRERLSPFSPPQRELVAFWSHRLDSIWKSQVFLMKGVAEGSPRWSAGAFAVYPF